MRIIDNLYNWGIILGIVLLCGQVQAQDDEMKISNSTSPDAKNTPMGSGISVDMYSGILNTSIPIYNYKGREINIPITIDYSASGVRVDQIAGVVGLGWNLNAGGRMNRVVTNVADALTFTGTDPGNSYLSCYGGEEVRFGDGDYYRINVGGAEYIFKQWAPNGSWGPVTCLNNGAAELIRINGVNDNTAWMLTAPDKTKYYFGLNNAREVTESKTRCENVKAYFISSWLLTKIISPNSLDEYTFEYDNYQWQNFIEERGDGYSENDVTTITPSVYKVNQQALKSISHNGEPIVGLNYEQRDDMVFTSPGGNALSEILFYNYMSLQPYKKAAFEYTYFGSLSATSYLEKRLKLDRLTFYGIAQPSATETAGDVYGFSYIDPESVPSRQSYARDYLGLYNARDTNINLIPYGQSRDYNFTASLAGTLESIAYPGGGSTVFEYEQNALNGGYGHVSVPVAPVINETVVAEIEYLGTPDCSDPRYYEVNTSSYMQPSINLRDFPGSTYTTDEFMEVGYANTTLVDLSGGTAGTSYKLKTGGFGMYLLQKLDSCTTPPLAYSCGTASFYPCLTDTRNIYYNGLVYSQPTKFVAGGLTGGTDTTMILGPGKYQLTVWDFSHSEETTYAPYVGMYRLTEVPQPDDIVDMDVISDLTVGFRVRSISNFSDTDIFTSKKIYKYSNGFMSDMINNVHEIHDTPSTTRTFYYSRGYVNLPVIHYRKIYEVNTNETEAHNGYIEYKYSRDNLGLDYFQPKNYPFYYNNQNIMPVVPQYMSEDRDEIRSIKIFDKNEKLVRKENKFYDRYYYDDYGPGGEIVNDPYVATMSLLASKEITDYPIPGNTTTKISNSESYFYEDYAGGGFLSQKNTQSGEIINYYTIHPVLEKLPPTSVSSDVNGLTENIYNTGIAGSFNGNPVTRYLLPTGIQSSTRPGVTPEIKTKFEYDNQGNRVTIIRFIPGTLTPANYESYIYGYNNRFPVAKISGVPYSAISTSLITAIQAASENEVSDTNDDALRTALQDLRDQLPQSMVTTYTYNPAYGVTSVTDPKGYTIYYEYDVFGRLRFTKTKNATGTQFRILTENQYNTRPN